MATAASSSWATGSHNRSVGKFILYRTDGKNYVRNVDDPSKKAIASEIRRDAKSTRWSGPASAQKFGKDPKHLCDFQEPGRK